MAELKELLQTTPVVIILDKADPFCLEVVELVKAFKIDESKITFFYTDKDPNGAKILEQTGEKEKPMIYLEKKFYLGGKELLKLGSTVALRKDLVEAGVLELKQLAKTKELIASTNCVVFLNSISKESIEMRRIISNCVEEGKEVKVKFVYIDKLTEGVDIEHAVLYIAEAEELPYMFMSGKPVGSVKKIRQMRDDFTLLDFLSKNDCIPMLPHEKLKQLKEESGILIIGNQYSAFSLQLQAAFNSIQLPDGLLTIKCDKEHEVLEFAAKVDSKQEKGPYLYIKGKVVSYTEFIKKDANLLELLKKYGVM